MERKRAVAAIVENSGKIVLGKKIQNSDGTLQGEWHIPGETVENNETDEEALRRGIKEEIGIEVDIISFIGSHQTPKGTLVNWYHCKTNSVNLVVGSDLEDARWVAVEEALDLSGELSKSMWPESVRELLDGIETYKK